MTPETVFYLLAFPLFIACVAGVTWLCEDVLGLHFDIVEKEDSEQ